MNRAGPRGRLDDSGRMQLMDAILIGEHALLRAFLRGWLGRFNRIRVVGEGANARQTLALVARYRPPLVLMDFDTMQVGGLDLLTRIRTQHARAKVIIYFAHAHDEFSVKVIRAGAAGFIVKSADSEDMEAAIRTVIGGGVYLSPEFLKSFGRVALRGGSPDKDGRPLDPQRAEILKLVALGLSTKAVAFELKISTKTVDMRKRELMKRLGVQSTTGLVKYAIRSGVVPA